MFRQYQIIACLCILFAWSPAVNGLCQQGWLQSGFYCYFYSVENDTVYEAQAKCEEEFADLLFVDDDGENIFIYDNGPALTGESYWIGYQQVFKSIWRWGSSGRAGAYSKWDIGEPDGEGGCARMTPYLQGVWRDWECERRLPYICKKFADCGPPEEMPLAEVATTPQIEITNDTAVPRSTIATYTCIDGSEYADEEVAKTSECSIGGVWVPDLPNTDPCQPKQCLPPPVFNERTITNGTEFSRAFGTLVSYVCESGYWFDQYSEGQTRYLTCDNDKTWRGDSINDCTKVYCVRPVTSYARADTPLNSFGTVATYTCDIGYEYSDNSTTKTFTCREDGWDPKPTPCMELTCPEFDVPNASPSTESRAVFVEVTWTCDPGMRFPDTTTHKKMFCRLDETWGSVITEGCERKRCLGPPPNASETFSHDWNNTNGEIYRYGDAVNYTCIPEWYFSDGLPTRQVLCNEDGEWTPKQVTDCLGEIVEVKHGVTHKALESEGSATFGTITMILLGVIIGAIVLLDAVTIGKHIGKLKENLCGVQKPEKEKESEDSPTTSSEEGEKDSVV